ncbi:MAG: hypothetical protein QOF78_3210 [Phycisphaerales bacterium]|jgi:hypothetical protein|nr:hypothetical protein [Phycisphaerales bacterium]
MNRTMLAIAAGAVVSIVAPVMTFAGSATRPAPARPAAAAAAAAAAATTRPGAASDFSLTIYSTADPATFDPKQLAQQRMMNPYNSWQLKLPGYGVVRETRKIEIKEGENTVRFTDVASGIDPTTVAFESLTAPDSTAVLEQNYEYDVVSAQKLLEKYLGKDVTISRRASPDVTRPAEDVTGKLLSSDPSYLVLQAEKGEVIVISRQEVTAVRLTKQDTGLITKPTLVWKLAADKSGPHDAQVTYQTDGLTWRADYNIVVNKDDTAADVSAWVSLLNESGASYPNAKLKLVAGDVQRIQPPQEGMYAGNMVRQSMAKRADTGFQEKSFFEYHLYTLGRPTSVSNNSTKQIELFEPKNDVPVTKTFVYYGLPEQVRYWVTPEPNQDRNLGTQSNKKVDIYLQIKNTEKNGLGLPLPAGRLRVYKQDEADKTNEFIGEDVIQHTPKDEEVLVKLGTAFDIVGERKQTDFTANYEQHVITESFEITVRNHKKEAVKVLVRENLFRWTNWEITKKSQDFEKVDYRTIHFPIEVPAGGEQKVTYTVKYTW